MWSVVLKILSILGIILLCLLALALVALLLVLFWPVSYRGGGSAQAGKYRAWFRFRWLFGMVRGAYAYPEGGGLRVKVLWLTVYDGGGKQEKASPEGERQTQPKQGTARAEKQTQPEQGTARAEKRTQPEQITTEAEGQSPPEPAVMGETLKAGGTSPGASADHGEQGQDAQKQSGTDREQPLPEKLSCLMEKLRFYLELVQDEDNQGLVKHGLARLGRVIKSLRPRFLRAEALVGLGEPDLTGYVYGIYWAVKPFLGKKCHVAVTPDFERRVLEGEANLGGRIVAAVILHHIIRVLLDRRLRQLTGRMKNNK